MGWVVVLVLFQRVWAKHTLGNRNREVYDELVLVWDKKWDWLKPSIGLVVFE